jgi:hypothetical protein
LSYHYRRILDLNKKRIRILWGQPRTPKPRNVQCLSAVPHAPTQCPHSSSRRRPLTSPFSSPSIGGRRPRLPSRRRHEGTRPLLRHRQEGQGYFLILLLSPRYHHRHLSLTGSGFPGLWFGYLQIYLVRTTPTTRSCPSPPPAPLEW